MKKKISSPENSALVLPRLRKESGFTAAQVAEYLGITEQEYLQMESDVTVIPLTYLERLADLYHVAEYDVLTGTATSQTVTKSPAEEKNLIPFFKIVKSYMKMTRLLNDNVIQRSD